MAFKPLSVNGIDIKKTKEPHIGFYQGKDEITTKIGPQVVWKFLDKNDQPFGVYGFTNLNRIMSTVKVGSLLRITYQGTQSCQTKFGMKDVHQVLVEMDDEEQKHSEVVEEETPF